MKEIIASSFRQRFVFEVNDGGDVHTITDEWLKIKKAKGVDRISRG